MARRRYNRRELERSTWHHWDPRTYSSVWVNNDTLRHVRNTIANPPSIDPEYLLRLLQRIMDNWENERAQSQELISELIKGYNRAVDRINDDNEEINRLNDVISSIRNQLAEAIERQNQIQTQIDEINRRHANERQRAVEWANSFIALYNNLSENTALAKFMDERDLRSAKACIETIRSGSCDAQAIQGVAVTGMVELQEAQRKAEKLRMAFKASLISVIEQLESVERIFANYANDTYFDRLQQNKVDMDYWSQGDFSIEYSELRSVRQRIDSAEENPSYLMEHLIADLKIIDQIRQNVEDISRYVMDRAGLSETIEAHGLLAALILAEQHSFSLIVAGYQDNDFRLPYVLQMKRPISAQTIELVFVPEGSERYSLQYSICFDRAIDEVAATQIINTLIMEMRHNEINIELPQRDADINNFIVDSIQEARHGERIHIQRLESGAQ